MTQPELIEDATEEISEKCPECGELLVGTRGGRTSLAWRKSQHLWNKHKVKSSNPRRRGKGAGVKIPPVESIETRTVAGIGKAVLSSIPGGTQPPTAAQLTGAMAHGVTLTTMAIGTLLTETDPGLNGPGMDAERDRVADMLTVPEDDAAKLLGPVGRVVAPTSLNRRFGRAVVDNVDLADGAYVFLRYVFELRTYMRERSARIAGVTAAQGPWVPVAAPTPAPAAPPMPAEVAEQLDRAAAAAAAGGAPMPQAPPGAIPRAGRVIGFHEAQAARAQQGLSPMGVPN